MIDAADPEDVISTPNPKRTGGMPIARGTRVANERTNERTTRPLDA